MELTVKHTRKYIAVHWRILTAIVVGAVLVCFIMLFRLGSITGHLSPEETERQLFASSWHHLVHNPLYLPQTLLQWIILTIIPHHGLTVTRAASPVFGVLALAAFAYVLRRWYGVRSAIYGTVLFGLSSWLLHVSRYGGPQVLYLWALPTLLALTIAWDRHKVGATHYFLIALLAALLYIPGLVWLIAVVLILQPHLFTVSWRKLSNPFGRVSGLLLFVALMAPLAYALLSHPSLVRTWLGLPNHFASINVMVHNLLHSVSFFVYRGPADATVWLPRLPILDFFTMVLAVIGVIFYAQHFHAPRTRMLIILFVVSALLLALGGPVTVSLLVPMVYLFVAAGLGYLLHEWLQVFPRNPLARGVGFSLIGVAVALSCLYNVRSYFVAWPHNTQTKVAFHKTPDN
jgi:hypothetical protein